MTLGRRHPSFRIMCPPFEKGLSETEHKNTLFRPRDHEMDPREEEAATEDESGRRERRVREPIVVADDAVRFGFGGQNRAQLACHWLLAVCIGVSLKMTTFPQALIAAELGVNDYARETGFLVSFGFTKAFSNLLAGWASDRFGRKRPHVAGWCLGLVLAALLLTASTPTSSAGRTTTAPAGGQWALYVVANVFLGAQQVRGLARLFRSARKLTAVVRA